MKPTFETEYSKIWEIVNKIDPTTYGHTRNYTNGDVTYLSPYISRGVISTKQVLESLLERGFLIDEIEPFVMQLTWRDYFQRVWQNVDISKDIKNNQQPLSNYEIPIATLFAKTKIKAIDNSIEQLFETGYMHNHCRLYLASIICNIAQSHWLNPAQWMYYHLIDGDWASNACSWQWVAGTNSNKKYYANQQNINKYTNTPFEDSFLNYDYEDLKNINIPEELKDTAKFETKTNLPSSSLRKENIDVCKPTLIYNYYNLDPNWRKDEDVNRILLLEPAFFSKYPVSEKCIEFMLKLASNIPDLHIYTGSFLDLTAEFQLKSIIYKEHPTNGHYLGIKDERDWISEQVKGYYPSFFKYWKVVKTHLNAKLCTTR